MKQLELNFFEKCQGNFFEKCKGCNNNAKYKYTYRLYMMQKELTILVCQKCLIHLKNAFKEHQENYIIHEVEFL